MRRAERGKLLGNNKTGFGFNQVQDFLALFVSICEVFKFSLIPGPVAGTPRSVFNQVPNLLWVKCSTLLALSEEAQCFALEPSTVLAPDGRGWQTLSFRSSATVCDIC